MKEFNEAKDTEDIDMENDYLLNEGTQILIDLMTIGQNGYLFKAA